MDKIKKVIYDIKTDIDNNTSKYIIILGAYSDLAKDTLKNLLHWQMMLL